MTDWNGLFRTYNYVGFSNFVEALTRDVRFHHSLSYTFRYVFTIVPLQNLIALGIALLVESRRRTKGLFRTMFFMPNIISMFIGALMWTFMFTRIFPWLVENTVLQIFDQPWLGDPNTVFFSILMVSFWHGTGYLMIIYIAALQGVPKDLVDAATIDGAGAFQRFRYVILPLLMPAVTVCLFLTLNGSFKIFDSIFALTRGGPGFSTEVIAINIYQEGFGANLRLGYATAKAIILFFIILIITIIQVSVTKRREIEL